MVLAKSRDVRILNVEYPLLIDLFRNGRTVLDCPEIKKKHLFLHVLCMDVLAGSGWECKNIQKAVFLQRNRKNLEKMKRSCTALLAGILNPRLSQLIL